MTKEELEKEANKYAKEIEKKFVFMDYRRASALGYLAGAEPREKRIAELEAQIEKMKCCGNCDWKVKGICNDNDNCELEDWKLVETWR